MPVEYLDTEELLHLSMYAASKGNHDDAINYLKQANVISPETPNILLMLAAEYAEIGMFDRALTTFARVCEIEPDMYIARLQSGLLLMALDKLPEARAQLLPLLENKALGFYHLFASGLDALIDENLEESRQLLEKGCESNQENIPLNEDIGKIIKQIDERLLAPISDRVSQDIPDESEWLLSAYKK